MNKVLLKTGHYFFLTILLLLVIQCEDNNNISPGDDDQATVEITPKPGMDLYGYIGDNQGNPIPGVVVSDGYSCTTTDSKGVYQMKKSVAADFVFYSTPADYKIATESATNNMARFYAPLGMEKRYDFTLEKLESIETSFTLIGIGDPQPASTSDFNRFKAETIQDIKQHIETIPGTVYGIALGDITSDKPALYNQMKAILGSTDMVAFPAIGNHDKIPQANPDKPRTDSEFTKVFGPVNYSFNRGDVHFICLDNIIFNNSSSYSAGFTNAQLEWLRADLSHVPKNKMIIVYYHIPIRGSLSIINRESFLKAFRDYTEVHLMSGHTHYNENFQITTPITAYEHVHAAACGSWWRSTINGDGTPNGYAVYEINGPTISNWYYKPTRHQADFQIRLHHGDKVYGGPYGYFAYNQHPNTIVANVWNADQYWKIEAFENDIKVADLTPLPTYLKDAWSLGYHIGVLNRNPNNYSPACKHLFLHTLINPSAKLEIRATDPFGNVYKQSEIISDYESATSY